WLSPVDFTSDLEKFSQAYVYGTREMILNAIIDWMKADKSSTLCQLGGAGVGKTMLAWLLNSEAARFSHQVGAYFFCKHNDEQKNNPRNIVSTLASQLASQFPVFLEHLVALKTDYDEKLAANADLVPLLDNSESFKLLIVDGLHKIKFPVDKTLLLIIDALDECGKQGDLNRQYLLTTIGEDCKNLPANIRLFVTSRPESDIVSILEKIDTKELSTSDYFNLLDIQIFVAEMLRRLNFDSKNPRHVGFINKIVDASEGVFVFAALACKEIAEVFVQKDLTPDDEEVDGLIERLVQDGGGLDGIYQPLFQRIYDGATEFETGMFCAVMGIVVTAKVALHPDLIAFVLKVRSILILEQRKVTVLHKSVRDFLVSYLRCTDKRFWIQMSIYHNILCERSLESLISDSDSRDSMAALFLESYAVKYWASHLESGKLASHTKLLSQLTAGNPPPLFTWIQMAVAKKSKIQLEESFDSVLRFLKSSPQVQNSLSAQLQHIFQTAKEVFGQTSLLTLKTAEQQFTAQLSPKITKAIIENFDLFLSFDVTYTHALLYSHQ
ncbi:hypothetical protein HK100_004766, partial [Physocladia obscura]